MATVLLPTVTYIGAAIAEIAGCFAFWAWLRLGKTVWWLVPGVASLVLFAFLLTRIDSDFAGRAYAAYGGVYIAASLGWLWIVEMHRPDRWEFHRRCGLPAGRGRHPVRTKRRMKAGHTKER